MSEQSLFPRSIYGRAFREGFVAALIESPSEAMSLVEALSVAGIPSKDVRVLPGDLALEIDESHHPSLAVTPSAPGELAVSQEYLAGAMLGDVLVAIRTPFETRAQAASEILAAGGARCIREFGPDFVRVPEPHLEATA